MQVAHGYKILSIEDNMEMPSCLTGADDGPNLLPALKVEIAPAPIKEAPLPLTPKTNPILEANTLDIIEINFHINQVQEV